MAEKKIEDIAKKQNEQTELERLSAQRELYSDAKRTFVVQLILTILLPVILAIISIYLKTIAPYTALFSICIFGANIIFLEPAIKHRKTKAAKIQELFDCSVFDLPRSPLKVVDDVSVEEVLRSYNAHSKIKSNVEKIKNWYPPVVSDVDIRIGRIICQRASCRWDKNIRRNYRLVLKTIAFLTPVTVLVLAFINQLSVVGFTLILSALVPFIQVIIKQINDNTEADCRLEQLAGYIDHVWDKIKNGYLPLGDFETESRRIQDAIYDHRIQSPLVLDKFYNISRKNEEPIMTKVARLYVEEAKSFKFNKG